MEADGSIADPKTKSPQAGVAVGIALIAAEEFPAYAEAILTVTIGTTVVFELLGPSCTLLALQKTATAKKLSSQA